MKTENKKMDDMMGGDEQILWMSDESPEAAFDEILFSPLLPFCIVWLILGALFGAPFFVNMHLMGPFVILLLPFLLFYLLPVLALLYGLLTAKQTARDTHYCITSRGIYVQSGSAGKEKTDFIRFDEIKSASAALKREDIRHHVGDVVCEYVTPLVTYVGGKRRDEHYFRLDNTPDFKQAVEIINAQKEKRTPKEVAAALTERIIPKKLSQESGPQTEPVFAVRTDIPAAPAASASDVMDPELAFFGSEQEKMQVYGRETSFLHKGGAYAEVLESLPDETVGDLQAELFGVHAEQQGAFPDPTVNALPELPEKQQGQFLQQ